MAAFAVVVKVVVQSWLWVGYPASKAAALVWPPKVGQPTSENRAAHKGKIGPK